MIEKRYSIEELNEIIAPFAEKYHTALRKYLSFTEKRR